MKVLMDDQIFSLQGYGGVSRYYCELARSLQGFENVEAKVLSPLCTNTYARALPASLRIGLPIPNFLSLYRLVGYINFGLSRQYKKLAKPDIVHQTYYPSRETKYRKDVKVIVTVYDMIHELFPAHFEKSDETAKLKRQAVERADHVICISENTRSDLLANIKIEKAKTTVIHLGIDHFCVPAHFRVERGHSPYFLFVGSRTRYKNFHRMLEAYAQSNELRKFSRIVCYGGSPFTEAESAELRRLGLSSKEIQWQHGGNEVLSGLYQGAIALVYPSLYEGFGMPPLEAMFHECPVICSNTSCLPEVVGNAAELVDPYRTEQILSAMERMLTDSERVSELKALGKHRAQQFTWKRCAAKTLDVYRSVLNF